MGHFQQDSLQRWDHYFNVNDWSHCLLAAKGDRQFLTQIVASLGFALSPLIII